MLLSGGRNKTGKLKGRGEKGNVLGQEGAHTFRNQPETEPPDSACALHGTVAKLDPISLHVMTTAPSGLLESTPRFPQIHFLVAWVTHGST